MAKITIDELLDSVPMGGVITAYAPVAEVAEEAHRRNMQMRGEWFDVACKVDRLGRVVTLVRRREVWNIASPEHLMQTQRFWRKTIQEWRM